MLSPLTWFASALLSNYEQVLDESTGQYIMVDKNAPKYKLDAQGNVINPHLTRDGSSRGAPLDINPRFGRYIGEPKSNWPPMEKPGTPSYQRAVDRVLKLHQRTAHASGEMLEHLIENSLNHGCTPGDSRYLPVCNILS